MDAVTSVYTEEVLNAAYSSINGYRGSNEDRGVLDIGMSRFGRRSTFAIIDGHGGSRVADVLAKELIPTLEDVYDRCDAKLRADENAAVTARIAAKQVVPLDADLDIEPKPMHPKTNDPSTPHTPPLDSAHAGRGAVNDSSRSIGGISAGRGDVSVGSVRLAVSVSMNDAELVDPDAPTPPIEMHFTPPHATKSPIPVSASPESHACAKSESTVGFGNTSGSSTVVSKASASDLASRLRATAVSSGPDVSRVAPLEMWDTAEHEPDLAATICESFLNLDRDACCRAGTSTALSPTTDRRSASAFSAATASASIIDGAHNSSPLSSSTAPLSDTAGAVVVCAVVDAKRGTADIASVGDCLALLIRPMLDTHPLKASATLPVTAKPSTASTAAGITETAEPFQAVPSATASYKPSISSARNSSVATRSATAANNLGFRYIACRLTEEHHPSSTSEAARIHASSHSISKNRVDGILAVSRCFGDVQLKNNRALAPDKQAVIAVPDLVSVRLQEGDLLLLASDGLTAMTPHFIDVGDIARKTLYWMQQYNGALNRVTARLAMDAIPGRDNITVALYQHRKIPTDSTLLRSTYEFGEWPGRCDYKFEQAYRADAILRGRPPHLVDRHIAKCKARFAPPANAAPNAALTSRQLPEQSPAPPSLSAPRPRTLHLGQSIAATPAAITPNLDVHSASFGSGRPASPPSAAHSAAIHSPPNSGNSPTLNHSPPNSGNSHTLNSNAGSRKRTRSPSK
jgi:serine/threonine protein phosphatase PrpC